MNLYNFSIKDGQGNTVSLETMKGKVVLIVNTATGCGFTPQYEGLQNLYDKYNAKGFELLDFPCNQFGNQAPGTNEEISSFCTLHYNTTFQSMSKIDVNGEKEDPLYTFLKKEQKGLLNSNIKWNFTKFLVDRDGNVVGRFSPMDKPDKIEKYINTLLLK